MQLKLLCDENLPNGLVALLAEDGHDVVSVKQGISDEEVAKQARREGRIIVTFDSDFANILVYPPKEYFGIIRLRISPPIISVVFQSIKNIFRHFKKQKEFRGKLIIAEKDRFRVWEN